MTGYVGESDVVPFSKMTEGVGGARQGRGCRCEMKWRSNI